MADSVGIGAPITSVTALEPRLQPGAVVTPAQTGEHGASRQQPPPSDEPTQLAVGTVIEAVVRVPAGKGPPAGKHLLLRIVAPTATGGDLVNGTVVDSAGNETLLATPIGLLALQKRLALAAGTILVFVVMDTVAAASEAAPPPVPMRSGWRTLEDTLQALLQSTPVLADELRGELTPQSGPELAGTLLFLLSALYQGKWPGPAIANALNENGQQQLVKRLSDDIAALRRLSDDQTTGEWRVLTLPLLVNSLPLAVRLYLNRRKTPGQDGIRFALEVELSRFGPVQIDAMLRDRRLILVLRSHRDLGPEHRQELRSLMQKAIAGTGLTADLSFATVANFLVRPLDTIQGHIKITA